MIEPLSHETIDEAFAFLPLLSDIVARLSGDSEGVSVVTNSCSGVLEKLSNAQLLVDDLAGGDLSRDAQQVEKKRLEDILIKKR